MGWLWWGGSVLMFFGVALFVIFFWLNLNTPVQTPIPVVGAGVAVLGFVMLFAYAVMT